MDLLTPLVSAASIAVRSFVSSDSTDEEKDGIAVSLNRRDDICSPTLTEDGPREAASKRLVCAGRRRLRLACRRGIGPRLRLHRTCVSARLIPYL